MPRIAIIHAIVQSEIDGRPWFRLQSYTYDPRYRIPFGLWRSGCGSDTLAQTLGLAESAYPGVAFREPERTPLTKDECKAGLGDAVLVARSTHPL